MEENLQSRTKRFTLEVIKLYRRLPKTTEAQIIGKQLLRSGSSVGANTRAAFRGRSDKEFKAKLGIVVEEADESIFWMEILAEGEIYSDEQLKQLTKEANELTSIFVSIVKK
jgi:four helix bundle protein